MTDPSKENIAVAKHVGKAFGGDWKVNEYNHHSERLAVDILWSVNRPVRGTTSYSTIGLSDHAMPFKHGEFPTRIELAGACRTRDKAFANVLASAAFCIMRSRKIYHPGTVMLDYVREWFGKCSLPHLYLTSPFHWDLETLNCRTKKVSWLLGIPISDPEYNYLKKRGEAKLEDLLEQHHVNTFDLARPSTI